MVNAVPKTGEALNFFAWLRDHPLQAAILAILPPDDAELLRIAAGALDDFLFWPVHGEELRHRILRLLGPVSQTVDDVQRSLVGQVGLDKIIGCP